MSVDTYRSFADLAAREREGEDYRITVLYRPSSGIAVIAPHGGLIEPRTGEIARAIAGEEFNLYLFEGIKPSGNQTLHITSHRFDECSCLALLRGCSHVIAVHGYTGYDEAVLVGGLDVDLKASITESLRHAGFKVQIDGHQFQAVEPTNVCNRCRTGRGVQLELSRYIRGGREESEFIEAVRTALLLYNEVLPVAPRNGSVASRKKASAGRNNPAS
ncbi:MAG TPA: poly-gamma-glutamate hydrolase family protein [Syntrophorhabdales bacterium]|nr:poly-gamma-glutamate hydrolase family protein [Syntrophorhabdales bacterium]